MSESEKYIEYLKLSVKLIDFQTKIRDLKKEINKLNDTFEDRNKTEEWYKKNLESLKKEFKETNDKVSSFTDEEKKEFSERTKIKIYEAEIIDEFSNMIKDFENNVTNKLTDKEKAKWDKYRNISVLDVYSDNLVSLLDNITKHKLVINKKEIDKLNDIYKSLIDEYSKFFDNEFKNDKEFFINGISYLGYKRNMSSIKSFLDNKNG
jgi:sugar-specific transcriptional regulator TrmB